MTDTALELIEVLDELLTEVKAAAETEQERMRLSREVAFLEGHLKRLHPELCSVCWLRPKHPAGPTCVECIPF